MVVVVFYVEQLLFKSFYKALMLIALLL